MQRVTEETTDQATLRYLRHAGPIHKDLQGILTQISGFALMLMTSPDRRALVDVPVRAVADASVQASASIRTLTVPLAADHHHHHLVGAAGEIANACTAALACARPMAGQREHETLVRTLKAAVEHMRAVSRLMPGFEPVNFGQACCAVHGRLPEGVGRETLVR